MNAMSIEVPAAAPRGRSLTRADLETMPDDGRRYELLDGVLVVSPAPRVNHQIALVRLVRVLEDAASGSGLLVLFAPVDVTLADDSVLQPDVVVARREDFSDRDLPVPPVLAVEVLSPSTRGIDLLLKKDRLERAGCPHYWVVDTDEPSVTAWTLRDGTYQQAARSVGDAPFEVTEPFSLNLVPSVLLA